MTSLPPPPGASEPDPSTTGPTPGGEQAEAAALVGDGTRLARVIRRLRFVVWFIAAAASLTGLVAAVAGLLAWGGSIFGALVVLALCAPAIAAPLFVARRTSAIARAASQPRELAAQARDLVLSLRTSPELRSVTDGLRRLAGADVDGPRRGRLRRGLSLVRLVSSLVGLARPDPDRHPLLVPFQPERLAATWRAVIIALWGWLVAGVVALLAFLVLLGRLL